MGVKKMFFYQIGFQDVIVMVQLMGYCFEIFILIGCQLEEFEDYGGGLCLVVVDQIVLVVEIGFCKFVDFGIEVKFGKGDMLLFVDLLILCGVYEVGWLFVEVVCWIGDDCFFLIVEQFYVCWYIYEIY